MTPVEDRVDAVFHAVLRRPPEPLVRAFHARLIAQGRMDEAALAATLRASPAFRDWQANPENRDAVTDRIKAASGSRVMTGPFAGMTLLDRSARGDGDLAPKLLGTYEQELHPAIAACRSHAYDAVVDIGCAEGYYAVGFARVFPDVPVFAFDTDPAARAILARNADANGCAGRIVAGGPCDADRLAGLLGGHPRAFVLCDCEGYEATLFTDGRVLAAGRHADLLIECHDARDAAITPALLDALAPSHDVTRIGQAGRDPNAFACLAALDEWDRWRAVWERRGPAQHWLFCRPRGEGAA